ncbi:hypothetical protein ART_3666 [Arthrobacter sp. PAMC 25486]|uniref:histidine kinase n=1 Tax=Arthrobacter sp. PAMC 25486 TaxID=1494608 RepID=UPI000535A50B|nr:histidine kinase [Arthrobacter sp. PAMC 25486]AIY03265.1 hypothetical protein ART_3666 [Arthrobacter sp. PAMC 25486]
MDALAAVPLHRIRRRAASAAALTVVATCAGAALAVVFALSLGPAFDLRMAAFDAGALAGLESLGLSPQSYVFTGLALQTLLAASYFAVAAILLVLAHGNRFAVLSALVLMGVGAVAMQTISALPAVDAAWEWPVRIAEALSFAVFLVWLLAFPSGRIRQPGGRFLAVAAGMLALLQILNFAGVAPFIVLAWGIVAVFVAAVLLVRHRRQAGRAPSGFPSTGTRGLRAVLLAFLAAVAALVAAAVGQWALGWGPGTVGDLVLQLVLVAAFFGIPAAVASAVLRQGLWDVKGALARTISASLATVLAVGAYLLLGVTGHLLGADKTVASVIAVMVVLLGVHPLHLIAGRRVERALYGERGTSGAVLAQLNRQLAAAGDIAGLLDGAAGGARLLLNIPFVRLVVDRDFADPEVRESGDPIPDWPVATLDLNHQGIHIGTLELALRDADQRPENAFTAADLAAVRPLADQLAGLLHAVELEAALRTAHQDLVAVREEERQRLRDNLHDGLGPVLGAVLMNLAAAGNELAQDNTARAQALVAESRAAVKGSVAQIRSLVNELRPPGIDDRGLVAAVRSAVAPLQGGSLAITVEGGVPHVGAAVESAAYRIAVEAAHNAVRHSGARQCTLSFGMRGTSLRLDITDDGAGLPVPVRRGVGLESMARQAEEAAGSLLLSVPPGGGTRVTAVFPRATASNVSGKTSGGGGDDCD